MPGGDPLADRQPDPAFATLLVGRRLLEDLEDSVVVLLGDPRPVVGDRELPRAAGVGRCYLYFRRVATVLDRVFDEVLEQLAELVAVGGHRRQRLGIDLGTGFVSEDCQSLQRFGEYVVGVDGLEVLAAGFDPRVLQQRVDHRRHPRGVARRAVDVELGVVIEIVAVFGLQQVEIARDAPQRLLEVMGGDVGELLEVLV